MYHIFTTPPNEDGYEFAHIEIVFDKEYNSEYFYQCQISFNWQTDQKKKEKCPQTPWYGLNCTVQGEKPNHINLAAKLLKQIYSKAQIIDCEISPAEVIRVLETLGYREAQFNSLNANYQVERGWDNRNQYKILTKLIGYSSYPMVIASSKQIALKRAILLAKKEIIEGYNTEIWEEWLKNPRVELRYEGKEWVSQKRLVIPSLQEELAS